MSSNDEYSPESTFAALIITLSSSAWIGLGKIEDPVTGGVKKNLKAARYTVDILLMLRAKKEAARWGDCRSSGKLCRNSVFG